MSKKSRAIFTVTLIVLAFAAFAAGAGIFLSQPQLVENLLNRISYSPFSGNIPKIGPPVGIMLENELLSRPFQKGLSQANFVYEAPAEGNITRFLAIFEPGKIPERVGPIRSARPYYLDWMHEYQGVYVHVGGSNEALRRLRRENGIFDADQFAYGEGTYFWRENVRRTALEHTMFSSGEMLRKLIVEKGWIGEFPKKILTLTRNDVADFRGAEIVKEISIDFGLSSYRVKYVYDDAGGQYLRFQKNAPHVDHLTGKQIAAGTIVVQRVKSWLDGGHGDTIAIQTFGEGDALILRSGLLKKARWTKESLESQTRFYDENGKIFDLSGDGGEPIWFEVVPTGMMITLGV